MNKIFTKTVIIIFLLFSFIESRSQTSAWKTLKSGTTNTLIGASAVNNAICYVSGGGGVILKTTDGGATWIFQNSKTTADLYSIYFINETRGFAVGNNGSVQMTNDGGTIWTSLAITNETLRKVTFINDSIGFITGTAGTILKTMDAGKTWIKTVTGTTDVIYAVFFTTVNTGYAVGYTGILLKTTDGGNSWATSSIVSTQLNSIQFTNEATGFVTGANGTIRRTKDEGQTWNAVPSGTTDFLGNILFADNFNGFIVGGNVANNTGLILQTTNGGDSWTKYNSGTARLYHIDFANENVGYAVGLNGTLLKYQSSSVLVSGTIFEDKNKNCTYDKTGDLPLENYLIKAEPGPYFTYSDTAGNYTLNVDTGTYTITLVPPADLKDYSKVTCPIEKSYTLKVPAKNSTIQGINFGSEVQACALLKVNVFSNRLRRCFPSWAQITYSNTGRAAVSGAKVRLTFSEYLVPISSKPMWSSIEGNVLTFDIGTLDAGMNGSIFITDSIICGKEEIRGLTQCIKAEISPSNSCVVASTDWDKSSMKVTGACVNEQVEMVVINHGSGNMLSNSEYRIFMDNVLVKKEPFKLNSGDSLVLTIPSNGQTVRVEADQHPKHPGRSRPRATIEACGTPGFGKTSMGFFLQAPLDNGNIEEQSACLEIRDSYDPNDKKVIPTGVSSFNYTPSDADLEYTIRFQNTGTDTAYNVMLIDTLSPFVDISTFSSDISSHPYTVSIGKGQVVKWNFKNIYLPDSTTDNPGSNGFVKYKIKQMPGNVKRTVISNKAYIYFDYNSAIITNETINTILDTVYEDYSKSAGIIVVEPMLTAINGMNNDIQLNVYPNPAKGRLFVESSVPGLTLSIINITGQKVIERSLSQGNAIIDIQFLPEGLYFYKIEGEKVNRIAKIVITR